VNLLQESVITLTTAQIGDFVYIVHAFIQVQGSGRPPTEFENKVITGNLNQDFHSFVTFRNPYPHPININVSLTGEHDDAFNLLGKTQNLFVQATSVTNIAFTFHPLEIREYATIIVIKMSEQISWKYPIKGVSELVV
jgi:hypothetical protein